MNPLIVAQATVPLFDQCSRLDGWTWWLMCCWGMSPLTLAVGACVVAVATSAVVRLVRGRRR